MRKPYGHFLTRFWLFGLTLFMACGVTLVSLSLVWAESKEPAKCPSCQKSLPRSLVGFKLGCSFQTVLSRFTGKAVLKKWCAHRFFLTMDHYKKYVHGGIEETFDEFVEEYENPKRGLTPIPFTCRIFHGKFMGPLFPLEEKDLILQGRCFSISKRREEELKLTGFAAKAHSVKGGLSDHVSGYRFAFLNDRLIWVSVVFKSFNYCRSAVEKIMEDVGDCVCRIGGKGFKFREPKFVIMHDTKTCLVAMPNKLSHSDMDLQMYSGYRVHLNDIDGAQKVLAYVKELFQKIEKKKKEELKKAPSRVFGD